MAASDLDGVVLRNAANERALAELVRVLRDEQPLLLVGAGSSFRVDDYPMWTTLLQEIEARTVELSPRSADEVQAVSESDDLLWRASEDRRLLGEPDFVEFIRARFGPRPVTHTPFHERLLALPWRHVLVTNYDPTLEYAHAKVFGAPANVVVWNESRNVEELLAKSHLAAYTRRYVYVHGRYDRDGIILTERDYQERYHKHRDGAERLFALVDTHPVVSVGFSMSDFDLLAILRRKHALREGTPRHFALLADPGKNVDTQRRMYRDKYGVEPVYYTVDDALPPRQRHVGLDRLVEWLHAQLAPSRPPTAESAEARTNASPIVERLSVRGLAFADEAGVEFGARLNLFTGINSSGKTAVLDMITWSLVGAWPGTTLLPRRDEAAPAELAATFSLDRRHAATFDPLQEAWSRGEGWASTDALVVHAFAEGAVVLWEPLRGRASPGEGITRLTPRAIFEGVRDESGVQRFNGLIDDVVRWQSRRPDLFELLDRTLAQLSPPDLPMRLGEPQRVSSRDTREFPSVVLPYGTVPVIHASAAVRRVLSLAYTLAWAWDQNVEAATRAGVAPATQLVLLADEVDAHLHPVWQRTIVPALLRVVGALSRDIEVQVFATTHSPLVLASVEPLFDAAVDRLFHFAIREGRVALDAIPFAKQGDVSEWLCSEAFGLLQPRSLEAERALEAARAYFRGERPAAPFDTPDKVHAELVRVLPGQDTFWPRWLTWRELHP